MYTILGATGNIGSKVADILLKKGEKVRVVARTADRLRQIVGRGAEGMVGDALDAEFLTRAFEDADAIFTLIPPNYGADDFIGYADDVGGSIAKAIRAAGTTHVVNLSSVGAELPEGNGLIRGLHRQEDWLNAIEGLNVLHLRPGYFMENLLWGIELIKRKGINGSAARGDLKFPMIATKDIAWEIADRLVKRDFAGSSVKELLGERDLTLIEATSIIGKKIGKPDLSYVMFPYDEAENGLRDAGFSPDVSRLYIEMIRASNEGRIYGLKGRTAEGTTATSLEDFCDEVFVPSFKVTRAA